MNINLETAVGSAKTSFSGVLNGRPQGFGIVECVRSETRQLFRRGHKARTKLIIDVTGDKHAVRAKAVLTAGGEFGADGFGQKLTDTGWLKVPQVGGVRMGDDVEVGASTTIDRGSIDDTVIGDGVKLDNQIQIGHNCRIGAHTVIASGTGVSGSTTIGAHCIIGGMAGFVGHIHICDNVVVTGAAVVTKDITRPGVYSSAFPAEVDRTWKRKVARVRRLEQWEKRLSALEKGVDDEQ